MPPAAAIKRRMCLSDHARGRERRELGPREPQLVAPDRLVVLAGLGSAPRHPPRSPAVPVGRPRVAERAFAWVLDVDEVSARGELLVRCDGASGGDRGEGEMAAL